MRTARLKDFVQINPAVRLAKAAEYPFVPMDAITPGRRYVEAPGTRSFGGGAKFCGGDTIFARITPCLENGKIAQFKAAATQAAFGSTEYWVLRARSGVSDPAYVFYLAASEIIRGPAQKSMSGASGRQRADLAAIENLEVPAPDLPTQRRIVSTLSAYDDLIENNTRRIAILEEMIRRIYEAWFVGFRFPGHENVKMVGSELGPIPEGWSVVPATHAVTINPKVRVPKEGLKPFVPMGSLSESSMLISNIEEREGNSGSKFQNGDTLFARITPCLQNGKTGYVQFLPSEEAVAFGSTEFIVLRSRTLCPEYVYALARSDKFRSHAINSMTGATGRQRVSEACFDAFSLAQPDPGTVQRFRGIVSPMFSMIRALALKNTNLRATRDLLLPKLISGELDVSALPEPAEAVAA